MKLVYKCKLRKSYDVAEIDGDHATREGPWLLSRRFQLAFMGFLGTLILYLQRASMSVAIVCMTFDLGDNKTSSSLALTSQPPSSNVTSNTSLTDSEETLMVMAKRFAWSRELRGWVLSSYYIGYILTQIPAGWIAKRYGAKWTLEIGMGVLTGLTILTPVAAELNVYLLMLVQALKGAASGAYYPVFYHMLGAWAPPTERSIMVAMFSSGAPIGTVLSFALSGYLCHQGYAGGWPSIFYTFGAASGLWCVLWAFTVYETPEAHPGISPEEKEHFRSTLGSSARGHERPSVPWRHLLTTWSMYSIFFVDMCYSFGWFVALNSLPQYLKDVLRFDIKQNGFYNSLPYLSNWIVSIGGSLLADAMLKRKILSRTHVRKVFETFGLLPSAGCALVVAFLPGGASRVGVVGLLSLWVGLLGFTRSAADVNQMELAPAYAGIIMGIDQTLSSIPGILASPIVGFITKNGAREEWRSVFILTSGIFVVGWLVYVLFATAEETEWSKAEVSKPHLQSPFRHFARLASLGVNLPDPLTYEGKVLKKLPQIFIVSDVECGTQAMSPHG